MRDVLEALCRQLDDPLLAAAGVIPWGAPVPVFGDAATARLATLGINPSNKEFVDARGRELDGQHRRFETLNSLGLGRWSDVQTSHLQLMEEACIAYFRRSPYDTWFRPLDYVIGATGATYYGFLPSACHLDLVPFATTQKWSFLRRQDRDVLLAAGNRALGSLLNRSAIEVLILNGSSVIREFERLAVVRLKAVPMAEWSLPRGTKPGVMGSGVIGVVNAVGTMALKRRLLVLGFNHNVQSSYGVTRQVTLSMRRWLAQMMNNELGVAHESHS